METLALILKQAAGITEEEAEPTTPGHNNLSLNVRSGSLLLFLLSEILKYSHVFMSMLLRRLKFYYFNNNYREF